MQRPEDNSAIAEEFALSHSGKLLDRMGFFTAGMVAGFLAAGIIFAFPMKADIKKTVTFEMFDPHKGGVSHPLGGMVQRKFSISYIGRGQVTPTGISCEYQVNAGGS